MKAVNCGDWHCGHLGMALASVRGLSCPSTLLGIVETQMNEQGTTTALMGMRQALWTPTQMYPGEPEERWHESHPVVPPVGALPPCLPLH